MDGPFSKSASNGNSTPRATALDGQASLPLKQSRNSAAVPFDYATSVTRLGGDRELFLDIIEIFLEDGPIYLEQAALALADGDIATLERAAHTLKGMSANFAAAAAVAAAYAVELHAREHRLENAAACFPQLQSQVQQLEAALREFRGPQQEST
jgi:HPt (histidine-containing phosphotransfer) domain-containing protein